ncbi:MAG: hypothetical protein AAGA20_16855, partial [Planctomycetota bacterium]
MSPDDDVDARERARPRSASGEPLPPYQPLDFTARSRARASRVLWVFVPVVALLAFAVWQR